MLTFRCPVTCCAGGIGGGDWTGTVVCGTGGGGSSGTGCDGAMKCSGASWKCGSGDAGCGVGNIGTAEALMYLCTFTTLMLL